MWGDSFLSLSFSSSSLPFFSLPLFYPFLSDVIGEEGIVKMHLDDIPFFVQESPIATG